MIDLEGRQLEIPDAEMVSVTVPQGIALPCLAADLHIKSASGKYLKAIPVGATCEPAELSALRDEHGIQHLYVSRTQRASFVNSLMSLMWKLSGQAGIPMEAKFMIARALCELHLQELYEASPQSRGALVDKTRDIASILALWVQKEPELWGHLLKSGNIGRKPESLGFFTGLLASVFSRKFEWATNRTTETLIFSALLCDIGLVSGQPHLANIHPLKMSAQQLADYRRHPEISAGLLEECRVKSLNSNVVQIVREHHAYCDGTGFPAGVKGTKMNMLSKLLSLSFDLVAAASSSLVPLYESGEAVFRDPSEEVFSRHPEIASRYERELLLIVIPFLKSARSGGPL